MTSSACEQNGGERGSGDPQENSKKKLKEMDRGKKEKKTQRKCVTFKKKKKKEEKEKEGKKEKKTHTKKRRRNKAGGQARARGSWLMWERRATAARCADTRHSPHTRLVRIGRQRDTHKHVFRLININ